MIWDWWKKSLPEESKFGTAEFEKFIMLKPGGGCLALFAAAVADDDDVIGPPRPGGGAAAELGTAAGAVLLLLLLPNCCVCCCCVVVELNPDGGNADSTAAVDGGGGDGCHCDSDSNISARAFCVSWNGSKPKSSSPNRSSFDSVREPRGSQPEILKNCTFKI